MPALEGTIESISTRIASEEAQNSQIFDTINNSLISNLEGENILDSDDCNDDDNNDDTIGSFQLNKRESMLLQESVGAALEEGQDVMNLLFSPATKAMVQVRERGGGL